MSIALWAFGLRDFLGEPGNPESPEAIPPIDGISGLDGGLELSPYNLYIFLAYLTMLFIQMSFCRSTLKSMALLFSVSVRALSCCVLEPREMR